MRLPPAEGMPKYYCISAIIDSLVIFELDSEYQSVVARFTKRRPIDAPHNYFCEMRKPCSIWTPEHAYRVWKGSPVFHKPLMLSSNKMETWTQNLWVP
ncbi:unnamed protein product, partial [Clonostachys chloroleuca]